MRLHLIALMLTCHLGLIAIAHGQTLRRVQIAENGQDFVLAGTDQDFFVWGVNYDHDGDSRLIEDYWDAEWSTVEEDFAEIKSLGANVVRVHLQLGKFMSTADQPNEANLLKLVQLVKLAERSGLYLNLTGLGCYHKADIPAWYDELPLEQRWQVQANFWKAIAHACRDQLAVFCYDLMNEPVVSGGGPSDEWLVGDSLGGKYFVQRIARAGDLKGRSNQEIAAAWGQKLTEAIRSEDSQTLITVGVIPWAHVWPNAKPLFYSEPVSKHLDFASVHFYPVAGEVDKAITALKVYDIGKPLVIEEFFPLKCSLEEAKDFIDKARPVSDGLTSFYWGKTIEENQSSGEISGAIVAKWLKIYRELASGQTP
ncbi:cellulase family glycosylhydrolase [Bremerella cremea]|uniref:cellulase family glycosylhydrolase n=1 Tax=Bremerella cremea TaxID=1031537 RepID=UPI0031EFBFB5